MAWFNDKFDAFIDQLTRFGLEYWRRYYGPYKAKVISNWVRVIVSGFSR
jgi:hypothetical protein